jgi:integrase
MTVQRFTDKWLQSPNIIPAEGRAQFIDALCPGLHLRVTVKGTRTFSVLVRPGGRAQRQTIGTYPRVTLAEARDRALETLRAADRGIVGNGKRSLVRDDLTLQQLVDAYVARHLKPNARSWKNIEAYFLGSKKRVSRINHLLPRRVSEITKAEVVEVIDTVMAESKPQSAVNLLRYIKMLFNWAAERDLVPANPFARIRPPARTRERDRVLSDPEIASVWHASFQLMTPYGQMYRTFLLTGQRRSEVSTMRWNEINEDTWVIPREKVKKDRAHTVPLTQTARDTLTSLTNYGADTFVFSTTGGESSSSNFAKVKREIDRLSGTSGWTIHDIRRTVRSKFAELRVAREVARKVMNHEDGKVDRIYNRYEYLIEKREALARWEENLLCLVAR